MDLAVNAKFFVNSNNIPANQGRMRVISCTRTGECVIISENWYAFLPEDAGRIQAIRALPEPPQTASPYPMMRTAWQTGSKPIYYRENHRQ